MITMGLGLMLFFIGIAVLVLITSLIRLLGPILIIVGLYYVYKTIKERLARDGEAAEKVWDIYEQYSEPEEPKDEAERLAEKYEGR